MSIVLQKAVCVFAYTYMEIKESVCVNLYSQIENTEFNFGIWKQVLIFLG